MSFEKELAEETIRKRERAKKLVSSGIRELDEMLGGGFRPGTMTLIQENLGSEGAILIKNIVQVQLALSNLVLLIVTDPTVLYIVEELEELEDENLMILNLAPKGNENIDLIYDRLDISVKIKDARKHLAERSADGTPSFVILLTLNPFFLNLEANQVLRIISDNLLLVLKNQTIDLVLMQKGLVKDITQAQLSSQVHGVIDLSSRYAGNKKENTLRIVKMHGQKFDLNVVPYEIYYPPDGSSVSFLINSAFLTSFETFRALIHWEQGEIRLAQYPYLIAPVNYFNAFLEIPTNIDERKGLEEILEKAQGIGRNLARDVGEMYFLDGFSLLEASLRTAALQGWGEGVIIDFEPEENLITIGQFFPKGFNNQNYLVFLEGLYRGIIGWSIKRKVRYMRVAEDVDAIGPAGRSRKLLKIRLKSREQKDDLLGE
ncbi:MAG: RAD55 family ATPase [Promethearchaeota archaeon]